MKNMVEVFITTQKGEFTKIAEFESYQIAVNFARNIKPEVNPEVIVDGIIKWYMN